MELRDRAVSPWPIPPARTPLEIDASLPDADVQELLGTEELTGDEPARGPQLQWATHTKLPSVLRLLELNCCAIQVTAAGSGGIFCSASSGSQWLGNAGRESSFTSQMGHQELHILPILVWRQVCSIRVDY